MDSRQGALEARHELTRIVTSLIKELGDKDGVNWSQVAHEGEKLVESASWASHIHAGNRHNHIVEKIKEG